MNTSVPSIDLRHLRHALALAEHGSFARAADACHITQPALTKSIQSLEAALGVTLFDRTRSGAEPTEMGRLVLRHAFGLDLASRELVRELEMVRGLNIGELSIGVGLYGGASLIAPVLARLNRLHPKLRVSVMGAPWSVLPARARMRDTDIIVAELGSLQELDDFTTLPLAEHAAVLACRPGHPLCGAAEVTFAQVLGYPVLGPKVSTAALERLCAHAPPHMRAALREGGLLTIQCESAPLLKEVVMESDSLAVMYPFMIERELASGLLGVLGKPALGTHVRFGLAWAAGRSLSTAASLFIELLRKHDQALAARTPPPS
jgi:DNA-binding transcriptional LysR family regulator